MKYSNLLQLPMISGNQAKPFFSIKYTEKYSFQKQLHQHSEQAPLADSQSIVSYRAAYNPQPSSRYRRETLSPEDKKSQKSLTLRQVKGHIQRTSEQKEKSPEYTINKDSARIDIQLYDENANGGKWEKMKGRVVYRNNTPKNSYYLLSSMKELTQQKEQQLPRLSRNLSRDELQFNSKFESGNAAAVVRVSRDQYCIFTREDTNTHGLRQWFYFQVKCNKSMRARLRIYSFSKHCSLYRRGMKPYIKIDKQWAQTGEDVMYSRDQQLNCYCLAFSIALQQGNRVQIANMPPYTYSHLLRFLSRLQSNFPIRIEPIGSSLGGVDIPTIQITYPKSGEEHRRAIVILGRTHPGETCSSFSLQRIAQGLCQSEFLRSKYDFFIVPMVNPDGVIVGNHRTSLVGTDLNRRFTSSFTHRQLFPEVQAVKRLVRQLQQSHNLEFVFDLHGHSAQAGVFAYAGYEEAGSPHFLKSRIIPKLLSEAWHGFNYDSCAFQQALEKATTARVHFRNRCNITSVTIEQSYGILDSRLITVEDWRGFGDAFLVALSEYTRRYLQDHESLKKALQEEIQEQLQQEGIQLQKKPDDPLKKGSEVENSKEEIPNDRIQDNKDHPDHKQASQGQQESMQSGDDDLQITEEQLNFIQQNMNIKVREPNQRQTYELNDNTIQYQHIRNHNQVRRSSIHGKLSLVSRILRTKQRKNSVELIDILTSRGNGHTENRKKSINTSVRLPSLPHRF